MDRPIPQLNEQLCSQCGMCVSVCPCGSAELKEQGVLFSCPETCATTESCDCGCVCEEVCPTGAISVAFEIVLDKGDESRTDKRKAHGKDL